MFSIKEVSREQYICEFWLYYRGKINVQRKVENLIKEYESAIFPFDSKQVLKDCEHLNIKCDSSLLPYKIKRDGLDYLYKAIISYNLNYECVMYKKEESKYILGRDLYPFNSHIFRNLVMSIIKDYEYKDNEYLKFNFFHKSMTEYLDIFHIGINETDSDRENNNNYHKTIGYSGNKCNLSNFPLYKKLLPNLKSIDLFIYSNSMNEKHNINYCGIGLNSSDVEREGDTICGFDKVKKVIKYFIILLTFFRINGNYSDELDEKLQELIDKLDLKINFKKVANKFLTHRINLDDLRELAGKFDSILVDTNDYFRLRTSLGNIFIKHFDVLSYLEIKDDKKHIIRYKADENGMIYLMREYKYFEAIKPIYLNEIRSRTREVNNPIGMLPKEILDLIFL